MQPVLYLLSSQLGWILSGRTHQIDENMDDMNMLIMTHGRNLTNTEVFSNVDRAVQMKPDFWNIESIGIRDKCQSKDDNRAMENFKNTIVYKDQRYHVTWPWVDKSPNLPVNKQLAFGRLRSLVSKLKDKPELMAKYNAVIEDQVDKGMVEKVERSQIDGIRHYIPHHAVIKPDRDTKN